MEVPHNAAHPPMAPAGPLSPDRGPPGSLLGRGRFRVAATIGLAGLLAGCASSVGGGARAHVAEVLLDRANFAIQEPIEVEVSCSYLFGGALGALTLPGIPLGDPALETRAAAALHDRSSGRFLLHVTRDLTCTSYAGLYSVWRLTVTADAVGFTR